jgi:hypothetical protein
MTKRIIDISPELERKIWAKIKVGAYSSFDHLVSISLENQLLADEGGQGAWGLGAPLERTPSLEVEVVPREQGARVRSRKSGGRPEERTLPPKKLGGPWAAPPSVVTVPEPADDRLMGGVLWGQFYRFLPTKSALRVLASSSTKSQPSFALFKIEATAEAEQVGSALLEMDQSLGRKFGERLSTSFPAADDKSRHRYRAQYLGYVRTGDGKLEGLLPQLKFVDITRGEGGDVIGITPAGLEFAKIENPLIDQGVAGEGASAFSKTEAEFLLNHIQAKLPAEYEHMRFLAETIRDGISKREPLNQRMKQFYSEKSMGSSLWSDEHVNTMRAGVTSRLYELGLLERERGADGVEYGLTELGRKFLGAKPLEAK